MITSEQIRAIRQGTGLSQADFAYVYEFPEQIVENWESGVSLPPPYVVRLLELAVKAFPPASLEDIERPD